MFNKNNNNKYICVSEGQYKLSVNINDKKHINNPLYIKFEGNIIIGVYYLTTGNNEIIFEGIFIIYISN